MVPTPLPLEHLYRAHRLRAVRLARRVLRDVGEAEDVVQDVFTRLLVAAPSFAGLASHGTWLHRVVLNRSLSALRSRKRRESLRASAPVPWTPEEWLQANERARRFVSAWKTLSPKHRTLVWMRDVDGLDYSEIAARLRIPTGTVKSALSRGRAQMQRALAVLEGSR